MGKKKKIPSINPYLSTPTRKRDRPDIQELFKGIKAGNWQHLSRAITLVESRSAQDNVSAKELIKLCLPLSGKSFRMGITGSPGVGKSTFIEALGVQLIEAGHKVAVLAIDPSSSINKGSILGDKTRMDRLSSHPHSFVRPSPAGDSLGGVARTTRESIILCEAAGYDRIIIETVGVGQSEIAVHSMTDFFLLLLLPGGGDELQGIKRGIMEMADLILINKADGEREAIAKKSKRMVQNALHILPPEDKIWTPPVETISALKQKNLDVVMAIIRKYQQLATKEGLLEDKRKQQSAFWLEESINYQLKNFFFQNPKIKERYKTLKSDVLSNKITPFEAADELFRTFVN